MNLLSDVTDADQSDCEFCNKIGGADIVVFEDIEGNDRFTVHMKCLNHMHRKLVDLIKVHED